MTKFEFGQRYLWVDLCKSVGILTVIWIHVFNRIDYQPSQLVAQLSVLSRYAVPAFFLASGFLQARSRHCSSGGSLRRYISRLIIPYFVASIAAIGFRISVLDESFDCMNLALMLLIGDAWGIYYFVPMLVLFSTIGYVLFRFEWLALPSWILFSLLGVLAYQLHFYAGSFGAELRNPLRWAGWFVAGWSLAVNWPRISDLRPAVRRLLGSCCLVIAVACFTLILTITPPTWSRVGAALEYVMVEFLLIGTALIAWRSQSILGSNMWIFAAIRWTSESSYPIYLYHYFIIIYFCEIADWRYRPVAVFLVAVPLTFALVICLSWFFGRWSGMLFGYPARQGGGARS